MLMLCPICFLILSRMIELYPDYGLFWGMGFTAVKALSEKTLDLVLQGRSFHTFPLWAAIACTNTVFPACILPGAVSTSTYMLLVLADCGSMMWALKSFWLPFVKKGDTKGRYAQQRVALKLKNYCPEVRKSRSREVAKSRGRNKSDFMSKSWDAEDAELRPSMPESDDLESKPSGVESRPNRSKRPSFVSPGFRSRSWVCMLSFARASANAHQTTSFFTNE